MRWKKLLISISIGFIIILFSVGLVIYILDEPIPDGAGGEKAEQLAEKMLTALNKPAWDSLETISWQYPIGDHKYVWNKKNDQVEVYWDDYKVVINTQTGAGVIYENNKLAEYDKKIIDKAFNYFYNDSFWLIAPYKIKDPGTIRKVVQYNRGEALLVQYTSGGSTPGDSYLWILDEDYRPRAWKFWASIIPIGGMEFTWEDWVDMNGAQISTFHDGMIDIKIDVSDN